MVPYFQKFLAFFTGCSQFADILVRKDKKYAVSVPCPPGRRAGKRHRGKGGLLGVFEQLGAFKASDILFRPLLRPLLGIPGKCGIAFISSFTGSDVAAVMTRELYEDGEITDDERTIFVAYQYAGSACINNTITGGAPLVAICPV